MLSRIRNSHFSRILWGLMALYLLNISVDSPDRNPQCVPEDLSINDQESIVEIIVEQMLGFENVFKEYDDHDTEGHQKKSNFQLEIIELKQLYFAIANLKNLNTKPKFQIYSATLTTGYLFLHSPPPEV